MKDFMKSVAGLFFMGAALIGGMRLVEQIWPKPINLVVCVEHPDTTRDCSKWAELKK